MVKILSNLIIYLKKELNNTKEELKNIIGELRK